MNKHRPRPQIRPGVAPHTAPVTVPAPACSTDTAQEALSLHAARQLPGDDERTPGQARDYVAAKLTDWGVGSDVIANLQLIVSELTTNAVRYVAGSTMSVEVMLTDDEAAVRVTDRGTYQPLQPRQPTDDVERGRGLLLVDAVASRWNHRDSAGGTTVEAAITLPPHPRHHQVADDPLSEDPSDALRSHP